MTSLLRFLKPFTSQAFTCLFVPKTCNYLKFHIPFAASAGNMKGVPAVPRKRCVQTTAVLFRDGILKGEDGLDSTDLDNTIDVFEEEPVGQHLPPLADEMHELMFFNRNAVGSTMFDGIRFDQLPVIYITATSNNTLMFANRYNGGTIVSETAEFRTLMFKNVSGPVYLCGKIGFKNARKRTTVAAQTVGMVLGQKLVRKGFLNVRVTMKGHGQGKLPGLKGLLMGGINIVSLTDRTPTTTFNKPRKPKK